MQTRKCFRISSLDAERPISKYISASKSKQAYFRRAYVLGCMTRQIDHSMRWRRVFCNNAYPAIPEVQAVYGD